MEIQQAELARASGRSADSAAALLAPIFADFRGAIAVRLPNGDTACFGGSSPEFTLVFRSVSALRNLIIFQSPLRLAGAYFSGQMDIEGNIYRALALRNYVGKHPPSWLRRLQLLAQLSTFTPRAREAGTRFATRESAHTRPSWLGRFRARANDEQTIGFHYDASNEFYRAWLDDKMVYSCAYFKHDTDSLDQAQANKLDHICRKLRLKPRERLLDIGCGWGALAIWAARHYGVQVTGITLSRNQLEFAQSRIIREGLAGQVNIERRDYRELAVGETFDKVVSVGMFEHVGLKNLPNYFATVHRVLKPGGLFLNHGITHDEEGWTRQLSTKFINRYVFPDGELDTVSNVLRAMESAQFEIWDVEGLRPHYAMTLRHWVTRLEAAQTQVLRHVSESTYRVWRLYMAACALHFEQGDVGVYQLLASKRANHVVPVPLTRQDLYENS